MKAASIDKEMDAIKTVIHALESLDETQCAFVLKTATERLGVTPPASGAASTNRGGTNAVTPAAAATNLSAAGQTPKQFLKAKLPKTDVQRIACLAYYLTHSRNQPHFKTDDLTSLNTEAGGIRFSNPHLSVTNATHQSGFLTPVGGGNKQITGIGEDLVEALPDQEAAKTALAAHRKPRKKYTKKGTSKQK